MPKFFRRPAVGLALGGGGVRGLAHIGVLKVLEQEGIPIDCLAGSSMGGLIAALFAAGMTAAELECEALDACRAGQLVRLVDLVPPQRGLLRGERVRAYFERLLGEDLQFEDLRLPLALTAVDLVSRKEVVLNQGPVVQAVLATTAFPGLFPPVERDSQRLVDGGVLNNVPADLARRLGGEAVIAVDVNQNALELGIWEGEQPPQGWSHWIPRFALDFYQVELIMTQEITRGRLKKARPEVLIQPEIPAGVTIFTGFSRVVEVIAAGEAAARSSLERIRRLLRPTLRMPR